MTWGQVLVLAVGGITLVAGLITVIYVITVICQDEVRRNAHDNEEED